MKSLLRSRGQLEGHRNLLFAALAVGYAVMAVMPRGRRIAWPCPLYTFTGIRCPTCGLTHATKLVLRGHPIEAANRYPRPFVSIGIGIITAWAVGQLSLRRAGAEV